MIANAFTIASPSRVGREHIEQLRRGLILGGMTPAEAHLEIDRRIRAQETSR